MTPEHFQVVCEQAYLHLLQQKTPDQNKAIKECTFEVNKILEKYENDKAIILLLALVINLNAILGKILGNTELYNNLEKIYLEDLYKRS